MSRIYLSHRIFWSLSCLLLLMAGTRLNVGKSHWTDRNLNAVLSVQAARAERLIPSHIVTNPSLELADGHATSISLLALADDGIQIVDAQTGSTRSLPFTTDLALVLQVVTGVLGEAIATGTNDECPAGSLTYYQWSNGLTLNAANRKFVGWFIAPNQAGDSLTTLSDIGVGSTLSELEAAYAVKVMDSSLGVEFYTGGLSGLLTDNTPNAVITNLWSGTNCIFR